MAKKSNRKGLKKWQIALIVIVLIIALIGAGVLYIFWDVLFAEFYDSNFATVQEAFKYAPYTSNNSLYIDYTDHFAQFEDEIERGMADDATDEEKALAAYIIYRVACLANETSPEKAKYTQGGGTATGGLNFDSTAFQVGGGMNMTATYYDIIYPTSAPENVKEMYDGTKGKYTASEEYTQIPEGAITANEEWLEPIGQVLLTSLLTFARRKVSTPEVSVTWNGDQSSSVIKETGTTGTFVDDKANYDIKTTAESMEEAKAYTRPYGDDWYDDYGLSAHDMSIHIINPGNIIGSSVKITEHNDGKDLRNRRTKYYTVTFQVDTDKNRGTPEGATFYAEELYKANIPSAFMDLIEEFRFEYTTLNVEMVVYENGYCNQWNTQEVWELSGRALPSLIDAELFISSDVWSKEAFCYDHDTIMQGFLNRWYGDNKAVGLPLEGLPFQEVFDEYEKVEYGDYQ